MTTAQLELLKSDFLKWTGGFDPETEEDIATYVDFSMQVELDPEETRQALRKWMREAATSR